MKLRNLIMFLAGNIVGGSAINNSNKKNLAHIDIAKLIFKKGKAFSISSKHGKHEFKKLEQAISKAYYKIYLTRIKPKLNYRPLLGSSFNDVANIVGSWAMIFYESIKEIESNWYKGLDREFIAQMMQNEMQELFGRANLKDKSPFIYVTGDEASQLVQIFQPQGKNKLNVLQFGPDLKLRNKCNNLNLDKYGLLIEISEYLNHLHTKASYYVANKLITDILCCFVDPNLNGNANIDHAEIIEYMVQPDLSIYRKLSPEVAIPSVLLIRHQDGKLALVKRLGYKSEADAAERRGVYNYVVPEGNDFALSTKEESIEFIEGPSKRKMHEAFE